MSQEPQSNEDRIAKLEESVGYADRHVEILSSELVEINRAMAGLARRFVQIEARLNEIHDRVGEDPGNVPPPHSAGPDIPKDPL